VIVTPRSATVADLGVSPSPPRSSGVHVSTLIKAICAQLEPERFGGEMDWNKIELGFSVERAIERAWAERRIDVVRLGEIEKDGIAGSPDGLSVEAGELVIEEIKCTWMSNRDCPEGKKFWHWLAQIKAYCYLADTLRARLHVLFVNGDYAQHREPTYCSWDLHFHQGELDENWMMLRNQKRALDGE
jgi:hypothetical protein